MKACDVRRRLTPPAAPKDEAYNRVHAKCLTEISRLGDSTLAVVGLLHLGAEKTASREFQAIVLHLRALADRDLDSIDFFWPQVGKRCVWRRGGSSLESARRLAEPRREGKGGGGGKEARCVAVGFKGLRRFVIHVSLSLLYSRVSPWIVSYGMRGERRGGEPLVPRSVSSIVFFFFFF